MANLKDAKIVDFNGLQFYHKNLMKKVDSKLSITDESVGNYYEYDAFYPKSVIGPIKTQITDDGAANIYIAGAWGDGGYNDPFGDGGYSGIIVTIDKYAPNLTNWQPVEGSTSPYFYNLNGIITNGSVYIDTTASTFGDDIWNRTLQPTPCNVTGAESYGITSLDYNGIYDIKYRTSAQIGDQVFFAYTPGDNYCYIFVTTDGINLTYVERASDIATVTGIAYTGRRFIVAGYDNKFKFIMKDSNSVIESPEDIVYQLQGSGFSYYSNMSFTDTFYEEATDPITGAKAKSHIIALNTFKDTVVATYVKNAFGFVDAYGNGTASEPRLVGPVYFMKSVVGEDTWEDLTISGVPEVESMFFSDKKAYIVPYDSAIIEQDGDMSEVPLYESKDLVEWTMCGGPAIVDVWEVDSQNMGCIGGVALGNKIFKANYTIIENKGIPADMVIGLEGALSNTQVDISSYIASDEAVNSIINSYTEA